MIGLVLVKGRAWREGDRVEVDWWQRFKGDCLGLFCGTREEFELFFTTMNNVDKDINFTCELDLNKNKVVYLDVIIWIDENSFLQTDLYTKPNSKIALLLPSSAHKPSVTPSSVYSLILRVNRICSTDKAAEKRYKERQIGK